MQHINKTAIPNAHRRGTRNRHAGDRGAGVRDPGVCLAVARALRVYSQRPLLRRAAAAVRLRRWAVARVLGIQMLLIYVGSYRC